jgi:hypothetical protein
MGGASIELAESIKKKGKEKKYHYSEKGKRRKKNIQYRFIVSSR